MNISQELFKDLGPEYIFIAQDQDGTIKAFTHKPLRDDIDWYPNYMIAGSKEIVIPQVGNAPRFIVNWDITLIKRGIE